MRNPLLLPFLAAALIALPALAHATKVTVDSAETRTTWVSAEITNRQLSWSEKDHALRAVLTFQDSLYSSNATTNTDDLYFTFPGTQLNSEDQTIFVDSPDGPIAIGFWKKAMLGHRFIQFQNTVILVHRKKGDFSLTLDIDTERSAQTEQKKQDAADTETFSLDGMLHKKD